NRRYVPIVGDAAPSITVVDVHVRAATVDISARHISGAVGTFVVSVPATIADDAGSARPHADDSAFPARSVIHVYMAVVRPGEMGIAYAAVIAEARFRTRPGIAREVAVAVRVIVRAVVLIGHAAAG